MSIGHTSETAGYNELGVHKQKEGVQRNGSDEDESQGGEQKTSVHKSLSKEQYSSSNERFQKLQRAI